MKKIVFTFATLALAAVSAANNRYNVKIFLPAEVGGKTVKAGEYTLELKENQAVLKGANGRIESEARIETSGKKFAQTTVRYSNDQANARIEEIRIGGTATTVVFPKAAVSGN
jgi:hypothetical protein